MQRENFACTRMERPSIIVMEGLLIFYHKKDFFLIFLIEVMYTYKYIYTHVYKHTQFH